MNRTKLVWLCVVVGVTPLFGSGFGLYEQGTAGMGSAGAYVSRAESGSALFYNPAGLVRLAHSELAVSSVTGFSKSYYSNGGQSTWASEAVTTPEGSLFWNGRWGRIGYGLGYTTTYDYEVSWEEADFPGRFLGVKSEFSVHEMMAGLGVKLTEHLNLGATLRYAQLDQAYGRVQPRPLDPANRSLFYEVGEQYSLDGDDLGFIIGLQYYRSRRFNLGLSYQSPIEISLDGRRDYTLLTRVNDPRAQASFGQLFAAGAVSSQFELPERLTLGFSTKVTVRTRLEADVSMEGWSSVDRTVYNAHDAAGNPEQVILPRDWDDTLSFRVSGDFQQRRAILWRIGIANTGSAVPLATLEPSFPDYDRFTYSFGVSYTRSVKYVFELAIAYVQNRDRPVIEQELVFVDTPPNYTLPTGQEGLYETQRTYVNLGFRYRFGTKASK